MVSSGDRTEIAFFDVETTVPTRRGQKFAILEFGSILVCPKTLMELESYSTLLRPADLSLISDVSVRCNGITRDDVVSAPSFSQIADRVYNILHGRIWAGHNIIRFDCVRVKEAFAEINRPPPEPKGTIDSLALLTQRFGRRAGDMKMASLATYFGLGQQTHRSLDDVRMNLEVLKYCATVLFLESTLPDIFTANSWVSPNATMRSRSNGKASSEGTGQNRSTPSSSSQIENHPTSSPTNHTIGQKHPMLSPMTPVTGKCVLNLVEPNIAPPDPFNMGPLSIKVERESLQPDDTVMEKESTLPDIFTANNWVSTMRSRSNGKASPEGTGQNRSTPSSGSQIENHPTSSPTNHIIGEKHPMLSPMTPVTGKCVLNLVESNIAPPDPFNMGPLSIEVERESLQPDDTVMESGSELLNSFTENSSDASGGCSNFLKPDEVSIPSITVVLSPYYHGIQRLQILHKNTVLHVCCSNLKVRFGINTKFVDYAGRPRLNFVMDASPDVCWVLDACDSLAQRMSLDSGSSSDWRPVVTRKAGFVNSPTIRMHLPTVPDGNTARWTTEMYQKESSSTQRIVFSRYDVAELDALFIPGTFVDAYFSLDPYDYQQTAGIRLVAKKLVIHSN